MSSVEYETSDGIATVRLNRPDSLNAMNGELMSGLSDAFAAVDADPSVRVVVLTGTGRGVLCGGRPGSGRRRRRRRSEPR